MYTAPRVGPAIHAAHLAAFSLKPATYFVSFSRLFANMITCRQHSHSAPSPPQPRLLHRMWSKAKLRLLWWDVRGQHTTQGTQRDAYEKHTTQKHVWSTASVRVQKGVPSLV